MKQVLISIQPKWVEKIASGKKTIEVRKSRPKLETPFKCYIYATRPKKWFRFSDWGYASDENLWLSNGKVKMCDGFEFWADGIKYEPLCGKVIGEFVCDKIYDLFPFGMGTGIELLDELVSPEMFCKESCLTEQEICDYIGEKDGYGWHISDLKIYDKPKELSEFIKPYKYDGDGLRCCAKEELEDIYEWDCETLFKNKYPNFDFENCKCEDCPKAKDFYRLTRPPQSWCYVENGVQCE